MWQPDSIIRIGERAIGEGFPLFCIAEAGVAHFGSLEKALALVDMAADAGADAVKFQMFDVDDLICGESPDWKERLRSRQLPREAFFVVRERCRLRGILFLCTAHDLPSLMFLHRELEVPALKVGSGEVGNAPYLREVAALGVPVFVSTGMHKMDDVQRVLDIFQETGNTQLCLLHCVTGYPVCPAEANLRAIVSLRERFGCVTGYSDHTAGFHLPLAAAALGARVIEKHITLDFDVPNAQDWKVSCGPDDLAYFVHQLRDVEKALGDGCKTLTPQEQESLRWARKSLVAVRDINVGERLKADMLTLKRPGTGLEAAMLPLVMGRTVKMQIACDTLLKLEDLV